MKCDLHFILIGAFCDEVWYLNSLWKDRCKKSEMEKLQGWEKNRNSKSMTEIWNARLDLFRSLQIIYIWKKALCGEMLCKNLCRFNLCRLTVFISHGEEQKAHKLCESPRVITVHNRSLSSQLWLYFKIVCNFRTTSSWTDTQKRQGPVSCVHVCFASVRVHA